MSLALMGPPPGFVRIGSLLFPSTAASAGPVTIPACKALFIVHLIEGYSGSDIAMLQFNGDTTITNYSTAFNTITAPTALATGSFVASGTQTNIGTVAGIPVSGQGITLGRVGSFLIKNNLATRKVISIANSNESGTTAPPIQEFGWGEWLNTAAQITSIKALLKGANNLNAGSAFLIYGDTY